MLPTDFNPLGINPYDGYMEFEKVGNLWIREQEILIDTANNLYIPSGINDIGDIEWKISVHGTYTLSADITFYEDDDIVSPNITMYINYKGGTRTVASVNITYTDNNPHRYSVSCTSDVKKEIKSIQFLLFNGSSYTVHHVKAENIMLSLHGETEYSPYIPNIYRCYGRSTQNQGRNLLPLPDYEKSYTSSDGLATATWSIKNNRIKMTADYSQVNGKYEGILKLTNGYMPQFMGSSARKEYFLPPGTYTASFRNQVGGNAAGSISSGPSIRFTSTTNKMYQLTWTAGSYTFTTPEPIAYVHVHAYNCVVDCEFELQIEEGPVATPWKPYEEISVDNPIPITSNYPKGRYRTNLPGITIKLDDDLRSVPCGIADYVEVDVVTKEKKIVRQIFRAITRGNENYYNYAEYGATCYRLYHNQYGTTQWAYNNDSNINTLCSHLNSYTASVVWANRENTNFSGHEARGQVFTFKDPSFIDDNAFKQFLAKGVEVCFALAEPTTTLL